MAFVFVVVQPWGEGGSAFVVADLGLPVDPFDREGAIEALDFTVLPWAVRLDELLLGSDGRDGVPESCALAVSEGVISDDFLDLDTVSGQEFRDPQQSPCRGCAFLIPVYLGIRQTGAVIDRGKDLVKAQILAPALLASASADAVKTPASALGGRPGFLTSMCTGTQTGRAGGVD